MLGPQDAISLHLSLKYQGQEKYSHQVTGPTIQKCREKASILILIDMHGKDKKWMEMQREISQEREEARKARNWEKPVSMKFDKHFIVEGSEMSKVVSSKSAVDENDFWSPIADSETQKD